MSIVEKDKQETKTLSTETAECFELLDKIYRGNYLALPTFAQSLVTYLYTDMPDTDDPRILAQHVATKGMHVLEKVHHMGVVAEEEEAAKVEGPSFWRDAYALTCGALLVMDYMWCAVLGTAYLISTSIEYKRMSSLMQQILHALCFVGLSVKVMFRE